MADHKLRAARGSLGCSSVTAVKCVKVATPKEVVIATSDASVPWDNLARYAIGYQGSTPMSE